MFNRTKRFFDAVWSGGLSTAGGDNSDAGVKIESGSLLGQAFAEGYRQDLLKCEAKLEAANDAFMLIECLTNEKESLAVVVIKRIHEAAQDGFRATQKPLSE